MNYKNLIKIADMKILNTLDDHNTLFNPPKSPPYLKKHLSDLSAIISAIGSFWYWLIILGQMEFPTGEASPASMHDASIKGFYQTSILLSSDFWWSNMITFS